MATFMLLSLIPTQVKAAGVDIPVSTVAVNSDDAAVAAAQLARLEEINAMDMTTLSRSEKKEIRNELRAIKSEQDGRGRRNHDGRGRGDYNGRHHGGTVYFMGGGGVLLIILLILFL